MLKVMASSAVKWGGCLRAFLRNSGWRLSQPARRSASAVRGDQGPEGLASRERSGRLSGKECPLSERISGISVYFGNTTSRTTRCRCVVEHCAGNEDAAFADQLTPP